MKVVVTGGAGFIGSHLVEKLVERGDVVTVLDDLSAGKLSNLEAVEDSIRMVTGSVCDAPLVKFISREAHIIFHLATQCLVKGNEDPELIHSVNDVGTYNVCLAAKEENCKIVYISSSEAYGPQVKFPIAEDAPMNPVSLYGATKLIGELYVRFLHKIYGLPAVIIRPFNTFGPRQREDAYAGVITSFVKRLEAKESPVIYGDGQQTRDFSYVSDIVDGILLLSKLEECETVNLGLGEDVSILRLCRMVCHAWGANYYTTTVFESARVNDLRKLCADISRAKSYGYQPKVSLLEGVRNYVKWYAGSRVR